MWTNGYVDKVDMWTKCPSGCFLGSYLESINKRQGSLVKISLLSIYLRYILRKTVIASSHGCIKVSVNLRS
jgi:hypothetical protein